MLFKIYYFIENERGLHRHKSMELHLLTSDSWHLSPDDCYAATDQSLGRKNGEGMERMNPDGAS